MTNFHQNIIDIETAGKFLGLSETSLKRLHKMGDGPICNKIDGTLIYCVGSLRDWALMKGRGVNNRIFKSRLK